jgi:hypothetical protein
MAYVKKDEFSEQKSLCQYISLQYPSVIFASDLSGIRLPIGLATKIKDLKCGRGIPDLAIYSARKGFHGLMIELKATGISLFKKNGNYDSEHLIEQAEMLSRLSKEGYLAVFCIGFDEAKIIIDEYLG